MDNQRGAPVGRTDVVFTEDAFLRRGAADQGGRGRLARVGAALALPLTLLSAILFLVGFWAPWLYRAITFPFPSPGPIETLPVSGSDVTLLGVLSFIAYHRAALYTMSPLLAVASIWDGLPFVGIVLAVALWRSQTRPRWLVVVYLAWLVFVTALTGVGAYRMSVLLTQPGCQGSCANAPVAYHMQLAWGLFVALFALALAWVALVALLRRRAQANATQGAANDATSGHAVVALSTRSRAYLLASGVFMLGWALWTLGLFFTPWVTAGCTGIPIAFAHFAHGSCMGLDGYDMLIAGLNHVGWADDQSLVIGALRVMYALTFAGVVVAWLLWAPGRARLHRLVGALGALWGVLAMLLFLLGWHGATNNVGQPTQLVIGAEGTWGIGPGVWLCAVGIVLAWVGAAVVWARGRSGVAHPRAEAHTPNVDRGEA